jgi:hypothetical protein
MANTMMTLNELNAERTKQAEQFFHPQVLKHWRDVAKGDAMKDQYDPIRYEFLNELATHVYTMAWSKKRDELGRAERDAGDATLLPQRSPE